MVGRALLVLSFVALPAAAQSNRQALKGDSVAIYNLVGELRVEAGSGSDVVVEINRGGADAAQLAVQTGPIRGRETLRIVYPTDLIILPSWGRGWNTTLRVREDGTFGDGGGWGWDGGGRRGRDREGREVRITGRNRSRDGLEAFADLRVTVPAGKGVALYLGVGKVFVSNVDGAIRVHVASADVAADRTRGLLIAQTGSGNVDVRDAAGDVQLETGSGDISVATMRGTRLRVETGSGNVTVTDGKATELNVETGSGDIDATSTEGDDLAFETGSGNIDISLSAAFQSARIETGSGNVTLRVPATTGAQVDLETGSGDIDLGGLTLQVRRIERDHVTGTLGDGRGRLTVETGSGNVRLVKL